MPTEPPRQPLSTTGRISLGALARVYPPPTGDEILLRWERQEARRRQLPARLMVHFVIALALWSGSADREVMHKLVEGLRGLPGWPDGGEVPTHAGITLARQRLGVEPLRALLDAAARPVATPRRTGRGTALGAWSPWTTRSWTSRTARTTPPRSVGPAAGVGGRSGCPQARVVSRPECGTHAHFNFAVGSLHRGRDDPVPPTAALFASRNALLGRPQCRWHRTPEAGQRPRRRALARQEGHDPRTAASVPRRLLPQLPLPIHLRTLAWLSCHAPP